jgi:HAMP domain-containing protein
VFFDVDALVSELLWRVTSSRQSEWSDVMPRRSAGQPIHEVPSLLVAPAGKGFRYVA